MLTAKSTPKLTSNQVRGFWAAWGGWALDGMDSFIYALVLQPALRELLPRSGLPTDVGTVGYYNGLLLALFLVGWGLSMLWGPIGDRFGRVRTLTLTILCYSVFTFAGALAANVWQLAIFRLLAGIGIGGEWTLGGTFVAEEWPEQRRKMGAGYMQTGYYVGILIAALLNATVGRSLRLARDVRRRRPARVSGGADPITACTSRRAGSRPPPPGAPWPCCFRRATGAGRFSTPSILFVSISGLWAGSAYVPSAVAFLGAKQGLIAMETTRWLPTRPCSSRSPRSSDASRCRRWRSDTAAAGPSPPTSS